MQKVKEKGCETFDVVSESRLAIQAFQTRTHPLEWLSLLVFFFNLFLNLVMDFNLASLFGLIGLVTNQVIMWLNGRDHQPIEDLFSRWRCP